MTNAYNNISKLNIEMKTKNKAKNISKYSNNKRYEYRNYSKMTLSQTPTYIYIYIYVISFPCSMFK